MYADDTVLYVHAKNKQQAAHQLTEAMSKVSIWLTNSCLHLNISKTVCMYFTKQTTVTYDPEVIVNQEKVRVVSDFKYLGIILDSQLSFKKHTKKVANIVKFNLANFKHIRSYLSMKAAKLFLHAMIFSHFSYCLTSWSQANKTILQPLESLYKQALKTLDRKGNSYHHCHIIKKHNMFSFENYRHFADACLVFKVLRGLAPPPLCQFIKQKDKVNRVTRATTRGDCIVQYRQSRIGNTAFSVRATIFWNSLPNELRECNSLSSFKKQLKSWIRDNYNCNHTPNT